MSLKKRIFRTLLRLGKQFDQNPLFKAFIYSHKIKFGSESDEYYNRYQLLVDDTEKVMEFLIQSYCGGGCSKTTAALLYKPNTQNSLAEYIRMHFYVHPTYGLNNHQLDALGFLSIRILFKSVQLAKELSNSNNVDINQYGIKEIKSNSHVRNLSYEMKIFHEVSKLQEGILLVSHPLLLRKPLSHSIMLILKLYTAAEDGDHQVVGVLLNKLYKNKMKDKFPKIKKGEYLYAFKEFPVYHGGPDRFPKQKKKFMIVHSIDKLASISEKIIIPKATKSMIDLDITTIDDDDTNKQSLVPFADNRNSSDNKQNTNILDNQSIDRYNHKISHSTASAIQGIDTDAILSPSMSILKNTPAMVPSFVEGEVMNTLYSDPESNSATSTNNVYMTFNFRAVSKELSNGTIQPSDIKIIYGCYQLSEEELQAEIKQNKYFMATSDYSKEVVMCNPQILPLDDQSHLEDPLKWRSGFYTWSKVLRLMGGEYAAFSNIKQIPILENAETYYDELNQHPKYGQYIVDDFEQDPSTSGDLDEDDYDEIYYDQDDEEDDEYLSVASLQDSDDDDDSVLYLVEDDYDDVDDE